MLRKLILFIICLIAFQISHAQSLVQPEVLFFSLPDYDNHLKKYTRLGATKDVAHLNKTKTAVQSAIRKSFKKSFTYCPVYFFEGKFLDQFAAGEWEKVVFTNLNGEEVKMNKEKNFLVASYNINPPNIEKNANNEYESFETQSLSQKGIVLRDEKMIPLKGKLRFTSAKLRREGFFPKRENLNYIFKGVPLFQKTLMLQLPNK